MRNERWSAWAMSSSSSTIRTRGAREKSFIVVGVAIGAKPMVRGAGRFRALGVEVAPGVSHGKKGSGAPVYARLDTAPAKLARARAQARPRTTADRLDDPAARGRRRPAALEPLARGS